MVERSAESQTALIRDLTEQIKAVERELLEVVATDHAWTTSIVRLQSIPGVGLVTATWRVVATANITDSRGAKATGL